MRQLYLLFLLLSSASWANTTDINTVCDGLITKAQDYSTMSPSILKELRESTFDATLDDFRHEYGSAVDDSISQLVASTHLTHERAEFNILRQLRIFRSLLINMGLKLNGVTDPKPWGKFRKECIELNGQWPAM